MVEPNALVEMACGHLATAAIVIVSDTPITTK